MNNVRQNPLRRLMLAHPDRQQQGHAMEAVMKEALRKAFDMN